MRRSSILLDHDGLTNAFTLDEIDFIINQPKLRFS